MVVAVGRWLRDLVNQPLRSTSRHNREVLIEKLAEMHGTFLELGPGRIPLLKELNHIGVENKIVLELEIGLVVPRQLGYLCLDQDVGRDRWDLPDASVDNIVSNQVLEHIPRTDHVIRESFRVLKPGGKLLISVPNLGSLANIVMLIATLQPPMNMVSDEYSGLGNPFSTTRGGNTKESILVNRSGGGDGYDPGLQGHGHLRLFTPRAMNELLSVHGFKVLSNHGGSWGTPILGKFLGRIFPHYGVFTIVLAEKLSPD